MIKLWIDDMRPAPDESYFWIKSVWDAKMFLTTRVRPEGDILEVDEINLDHDAGEYYEKGGDYIKILDWLEGCQRLRGWHIYATFKFHSMNPVGVQNMKRVCKEAGWRVE